MKLNAPFFIGSALAPSVRVGDAVLSLLKVEEVSEGRQRATFELRGPGADGCGPWYVREES